MKVGTKSVLFGVHQFLIHPWFVAWAWWKLYGFPADPRLWFAFFVHDLGYFGKPNMDGPEGERHVELGARIMHRLFDRGNSGYEWFEWSHPGRGVPWRMNGRGSQIEKMLLDGWIVGQHFESPNGFTLLRRPVPNTSWRDLCLYHSRFYAKRDNAKYSRLCVADKLAIAMMPAWMYLPLARLTGELHEYMQRGGNTLGYTNPVKWYAAVREWCREWAFNHKNGMDDTETCVRNN